MKLFLISQNQNTGYDTYDSAVVIAENEEDARLISPDAVYNQAWSDVWNEEKQMWISYDSNGQIIETYAYRGGAEYGTYAWTAPQFVNVEYLGEAKEGSVRSIVCSSFNAG